MKKLSHLFIGLFGVLLAGNIIAITPVDTKDIKIENKTASKVLKITYTKTSGDVTVLAPNGLILQPNSPPVTIAKAGPDQYSLEVKTWVVEAGKPDILACSLYEYDPSEPYFNYVSGGDDYSSLCTLTLNAAKKQDVEIVSDI